MRKSAFVGVLVSVLWVGVSVHGMAQCAMCKTSVESNQYQEKVKAVNKAKGLNRGILYLMTIPYLLIGGGAYLWYTQSKKSKSA